MATQKNALNADLQVNLEMPSTKINSKDLGMGFGSVELKQQSQRLSMLDQSNDKGSKISFPTGSSYQPGAV